MKENFFNIVLVGMLAVFVGFLFWYGEKVVGGVPDPGYSVLSFKTASKTINLEEGNLDTMIFFIHNIEKEAHNYNVSMLINGEKIDSFERKIGFDKLFFKPAAPLKRHIGELDNGVTFEFKVVARWDDKEEFITKKITKDE